MEKPEKWQQNFPWSPWMNDQWVCLVNNQTWHGVWLEVDLVTFEWVPPIATLLMTWICWLSKLRQPAKWLRCSKCVLCLEQYMGKKSCHMVSRPKNLVSKITDMVWEWNRNFNSRNQHLVLTYLTFNRDREKILFQERSPCISPHQCSLSSTSRP